GQARAIALAVWIQGDHRTQGGPRAQLRWLPGLLPKIQNLAGLGLGDCFIGADGALARRAVVRSVEILMSDRQGIVTLGLPVASSDRLARLPRILRVRHIAIALQQPGRRLHLAARARFALR